MAKQALGKGLGALISPSSSKDTAPIADEQPREGDRVIQATLDQIVPSPFQPRRQFKKEQLSELVESIREHGIIQPLIVREVAGKLELIAGERRWRASTILKLETVPAIVRQASDQDVLEMALIENIQREDLNPVEEAQAYVRLARDFSMRQEDIAQRVGKNRATVANAMRLLDLAPAVQDHLADGRLSVGHAKVILSLKDEASQEHIADQVVRTQLTVRATERLIAEQQGAAKKSTKGGKSGSKGGATSELDAAVLSIQDQLCEHLSTKVKIAHGAKKGKIEIEYYGNEDLDRILEQLGVK